MIKKGWAVVFALVFALSSIPAAFAAGGFQYGDQLKDEERELYDAISRNLRAKTPAFDVAFSSAVTLKDEAEAQQKARDAGLRAYEAFYRDYPEVFWVTKEGGVAITPDIQTIGASAALKGEHIETRFFESDQIDAKQKALDDAAGAILSKVSGSDYDKVKSFHDAIIAKCEYDMDARKKPSAYPDSFEAYGALVTGKAVCEGYAKALKLLCDKAGISCVLVGGKANDEDHMWNYVLIGGNWYLADATFDDPVGGSSKTASSSSSGSDPVDETYFLKGSASSGDHQPGGGFIVGFDSGFVDPSLSEKDFVRGKSPTTQAAEEKEKEYCSVRWTSEPGGRCMVSYTGIGEAVDQGQLVLNGINLSIEALPSPGYRVKEIKVTMGAQTVTETEKNPLRLNVSDDCLITASFEPGA